MRTYDNYKESGIQWIGEIPGRWINASFRRICERNIVGIAEAATDSYNEKGVPILRSTNIKNGVIQGEIYLIDEAFDEKNKSKRLFKNDIITVRTGYPGQSAIITEELHNCQCFTLLISTLKSNVNPKFYNFYINGYCGVKYFEITAWGSAQLNISVPILQELPITIPPIEEQTAIANYLDSKTTEIDQVVADKEALVSLYEEEKKALINEAVTKGLNADAKLKPSGIDWLGEVPEHWEYISIKRIVETKVTDGPHESPDFIEEGVSFISAEAIKENKIDFGSCRGYISKELDEIYSKKCKPRKEDILLVKSGSTTGKVAMVETDLNFNIWSPLALIRSNKDLVNSTYFFYSLLSEQFKTLVELFWSFGTQPNIGMNVIENLKIAVPPLSEQTAIVQYIESETANINDKINQIKQEIDLLKEYRQALIFEAVTGKVRVD